MVTNVYNLYAWLLMTITEKFCFALSGNFASSAIPVKGRLASDRLLLTDVLLVLDHIPLHLSYCEPAAVMTAVSSLSKVTFGNNIPGWATAVSSKPAVIILQVGFCLSRSRSYACASDLDDCKLATVYKSPYCVGVVGYY